MSHYIFDNAAREAEQRFGSLAVLYDPNTVSRLERIGVDAGWSCLEVGAGGGSVAAWLAQKVGPTGRVVATDIDIRHMDALSALGHRNVEVQRHDVGADPLPEAVFDLVHARLVLIHVAQRRDALTRMVAALRPGGLVVIEDFDPSFIDRTWVCADEETAALYRKMQRALGQLMAARGGELGWGRNLYRTLQAQRLNDVGMDAYMTIYSGSSAGTRLDQANFRQIRAEAVQAGFVTDSEVDELLARMDQTDFTVSGPVMFTAWGRRPA